MTADFGVVLLWLIPAAAAALIAWVRGRRLARRLRALRISARDDVTALVDDLGHVLDQRDRLAVRVDALERDLTAERRHSDEWRKRAQDNQAWGVENLRRAWTAEDELSRLTSKPVPTPVPSDLDRARQRRGAKGRFVAKAVAE